ncbi:hypothetical protein N7G274_008048 [Stereocaulon virgatum]|uniref:Zn(2)-C6 fungal-type domain-containing protein n=1 Tax=Stereocaulon virgatum TaxID=373712 RepID=A0ABR4A0I3_9LECA
MSSGQPRKRIRKGTHSCTECRRRKKSCIAHAANPNICAECYARGTLCREQEPSRVYMSPPRDSRQSLQQRVTELENTLQSITRTLGHAESTLQPEQNANKVLKQLRSDILLPTPSTSGLTSPAGGLERAPIFSLFNNAILSRRQDDGNSIVMPTPSTDSASEADPAVATKTERSRQALMALFPTPQRLETILNAANPWWAQWQHLFPEILGVGPSVTFKDFIQGAKSSGNLLQLGKALLCLSISLKETPVGNRTVSDMSTAEELITRYVTAVDELVLSNDELAGTLDGIECMFIQAQYDTNDGRVRQGWLTYRRAIAFAQLLGLHLSTTRSEQSSTIAQRKQSIWRALCAGDRHFSLILGLPYGISESLINDAVGSNGGFTQSTDAGKQYVLQLARVAGHIIDRNLASSSNDALILTVKLEGELSDLATSMPSNWWVREIDEEDILPQMCTRFVPQFGHHLMRTLLHLPFMLKAATDPRYSFNKIATLESAREMIRIYQLFRPVEDFGSHICRILDFQVFTAAMILVLNHLGLSQSSCASELRDAEDDRVLVSSVTSILQRASLHAGGKVATQAARALEMLGKAKDQGFPGGQGTWKVAIPYFGTVVFGPGKSYVNQPKSQVPAILQQPTPEGQSLATPIPDQWYSGNDLAMPSDFNFNAFPLQHTTVPGMDSNFSADFSSELDGDWSWFWNNTDFSHGEAQI